MDIFYDTSVLTDEFIKGLSDEELIALADLVGKEIGRELVTKTERENAIESRMAKGLNKDYVDDLYDATETSLKKVSLKKAEMDEINLALREIGTTMDSRDVTNATNNLQVNTTALARVSRHVTGSRIGSSGPSGSTITASFSQADLNAINSLAESQLWWIGDYWDDSLSKVISSTISKESLATGLGREQVGKIIHGIVEGSIPGVAVPGTFRGSSEQYFQMLAGTVRNRASNFGAISAMNDAGFTTYRIQAVMDERTSERCRFMHNRTFKVSQGKRHIERSLAAKDPDEYKEIAGWKTEDEMKLIAGDGDDNSQQKALAASGLSMPPYHARCRTLVIEEN